MPAASLQALVQEGSPFALTKINVSGREQTVFRYGATSLPQIYRKALKTANRRFLTTDEREFSVGELLAKAAAFSLHFAKHGIRLGDRVGLLSVCDSDWIAAFVALTSMGATAVLTGQSDPDRQMALANCSFAIADHVTTVGHCKTISLDNCGDSQNSDLLPAADLDPEQEACIAFTSGSSGEPKAVILTHRGITTGLMNMMLAGAVAARSTSGAATMRVGAPPAALLRTPLSHISGYMQLLLMLIAGGRIIRSARSASQSLIAQHQITSIIGICDDEIAAFLDIRSSESLKTLRSIAVVGRSLPTELRRALRESLPDLGLGSGYGLTETSGLVSAIGTKELDLRPHAVGPLLPTVECQITRKDGQRCEAGESGIIHLRGAMLMRGYCHAEVLRNGWFSTGDVGHLSDDGYLHVFDRENRFLQSGDVRISCQEIEDAACQATGVSEIAALPLDDQELLIVTAADAVDFQHLRATLSQRFPAELMTKTKFVSASHLPRTASGKIAYARLLAEAAL